MDPDMGGGASRLMGNLLSEISRRRHLRALLEELSGKSTEGLMPLLVDELERYISDRLEREGEGSGRAAGLWREGLPGAPTMRAAMARQGFSPRTVLSGARGVIRASPPSGGSEAQGGSERGPDFPAAVSPPPASPVPPDANVIRPVALSPAEPSNERLSGVTSEVPVADPHGPATGSDEMRMAPRQETAVPFPRQHQDRTPFDLSSDDTMYCHAVAPIPLEERPSLRPFMLEEKGIENREFAFAMDRGGLRFFLSRFNNRSQSISKSGILLLSKQESIRLRGVHASVLNGLRVHGLLLPFEFGTVAVGKEALLSLIDDHLYDLRDAVDDLLTTRRWTLSVSILDTRLAQFVGSETPAERRERERARAGMYAPATAGRMDIKTLERVLSKEKKIAESIHEEVRVLAGQSGIESMVGLDSGTTDDWKVILRAWYDIDPADIPALNRLLNDIQYRHFLFELMLSLSGARDSYALRAV